MKRTTMTRAGIATNTGLMTGFRFPVREYFSLLHSVQTGSGTQPDSCRMGNGCSFPGVKRPGREADYTPPSSAEVKNGGAVPPLPHVPLWHSA
jgi:hypothetical protein